ncbi:MAG: molybdenum cofactor guanylyltransferase [Pirellulales bacterium]
MTMRRGAIVLCGGKSQRMGSSKAMLPFGPETMLERVIRLLGESVESVVAVAAPGQQLPPLPKQVTVVRDRREGRGPLEGLAVGLAASRQTADCVYATGCDVPLLQAAFVQRLFQLAQRHEIVVPIDGSYHHPLSAVYRTRVLPHVERLLAADRLRPIYLFDEVDTLEVPVEELRDVDPQLETLENVNRPEQYRTALQKAGLG